MRAASCSGRTRDRDLAEHGMHDGSVRAHGKFPVSGPSLHDQKYVIPVANDRVVLCGRREVRRPNERPVTRTRPGGEAQREHRDGMPNH